MVIPQSCLLVQHSLDVLKLLVTQLFYAHPHGPGCDPDHTQGATSAACTIAELSHHNLYSYTLREKSTDVAIDMAAAFVVVLCQR